MKTGTLERYNGSKLRQKKGSRLMTWGLAGLLLFCVAESLQAQDLKKVGTSAADIVPNGWQHQTASGDFNHDGCDDLVVVATPNDPANMRTRDDGYVYNFNQPILAIYFGTPQGTFRLWRQYAEVIPPNVDEIVFVDVTPSVTDRGVLRLAIETFASMGSYGTDRAYYSYRYQQGDFYLIGRDRVSGVRNTGETETVSENFLTHRRQVVKGNMFDVGKNDSERWSRLPRKPLEKLGARMLQ